MMNKSILLLFLPLCLSVLSHAQIVYIPDPNFKAYLVENSAINTNGDAEIQVSEAKAFNGRMDVQGKQITDLTGLEAFISITRLHTNGNSELKNLDVSQNIALTHLTCTNNNLTSLDVSQLPALYSLDCFDNHLTSLDVSNNPALTILSCPLNQITSLDVSQNPALYKLECGQNQLTSLDVSQNSVLRELWCSNNNLTKLDISHNSSLTFLHCGYNNLVSLDVRNGDNIYIRTIHTTGNPNLFCVREDLNSYSRYFKDSWTETGGMCFSEISGIIVVDDNDCFLEGGEEVLEGVIVRSKPHSYYGLTDEFGEFVIFGDTGEYLIEQIFSEQKGKLIRTICPQKGYHNINFHFFGQDTSGLDFNNEVTYCPYLSVDVSSTRRRRCFRNKTFVSYKNEGFADASDAEVHLKLPEHVNLISADYAYTIGEEGEYVFNIGDLAKGAKGKITVIDSVSCELGITGLTQCTEAWITPVNNCVRDLTFESSDWDNSDIEVLGECIGDGVSKFTIFNNGQFGFGDMSSNSEFRVYADNELVNASPFQLNGKDGLTIELNSNGKAIRLEADQHTSFPGYSKPRATIEGCAVEGEPVSLGMVNQVDQDDVDPEVEIDCMEIIDSYDPNDKTVSPSGITAFNNVYPATLLDYRIRFQNTGTDTAYKVVVVDTLSPNLDLSTIQWGSSSYPYTLDVSGQGSPVLTFTFDGINLPDSTTNELESQGYVKFKIAPYDTLAIGTVIENVVDIYFDYNLPIRTNVASVTISEHVPTGEALKVEVVTGANEHDISYFSVSPNPFSGELSLSFGTAGLRTVKVFDVLGKEVLSKQVSGSSHSLKTTKLQDGMYFIQIKSETSTRIEKVLKK